MLSLNASQLAEHLGVTRGHISNALKAQERAKLADRAYEGHVPLPSGYSFGKPYWII